MSLSRHGGLHVGKITIKPFFKAVDLWIGVYIDRPNQTIYICPVPMFGLKIRWVMEEV